MAALMKTEGVRLKMDYEGQKSQTFDCIKTGASDDAIYKIAQGIGSLSSLNVDQYVRVETFKVYLG
ncbi:MAG: hypothetical protein ACRDD8_11420 [Bacteroidales bacterium]